MTQARHFWVSGRVQGVSFRACTVEKARKLGLAGWVRNLADGNVEVLAQGEPQILDVLEDWLWGGSPAARVESVSARAVPVDESLGEFSIAPDA